MFRSVETRIQAFLFLTLVVLLGNIVLSDHAITRVVANDTWVKHTYDVLGALDDTLLTVEEAEDGARGYLLTGVESDLEPYKMAVASVNQDLEHLQQLTADREDRQQKMPLLRGKVEAKLAELGASVEVRRRSGLEAARLAAPFTADRALTSDIHNMIFEMEHDEQQLLVDRDAESRASVRQAKLTFLAIGSLAGVMLGLFYYQVKRNNAERVGLLHAEQTARAQAELSFKAEQRSRDQAETASRLKDEFLATVSHELRTPLNAILGWARMLRSGRLDEATSARAMETIERNAKSQAQLIEDLLDVSRIISGKLRLEIRPVDLTSVVEAAIDAVQPAADAKEIELIKIIDPQTGLVTGDSERLQQVIWNLLSNAIKFTPRGGRVELRLERVHSQVEIVVSDTGKGMAAEFLPHVFEVFRQAESAISRSQSGLGLGLAISRRIVEMHGGTIYAESAGSDLGSTFTVQLPLRGLRALQVSPSGSLVRTHPTAGIGIPFANLPALDGLRVLAVDDQPDTLEMIAAALTQCGAIVQTVTSACEALTLLQESRPDLLVADIGMPGEDGYALIAKVRTLPAERGGTIPAVALTAYARVEDRMKTLSAGYQMHVPKPVEPAELATIIASLAGRLGKASSA